MMYLRNKRGQIAILMLFIVALVLVISTLFVLFSSDSASPPSSGFSELISDGHSNIDGVKEMAKLIAEENITKGISFLKAAEMRDNALTVEQKVPYGNFFAKIVVDKAFSFENFTEGEQKLKLYRFNATGFFVQASFGNNYEKKKFDLCMLFDGNGRYLKELANEGVYKTYCGRL